MNKFRVRIQIVADGDEIETVLGVPMLKYYDFDRGELAVIELIPMSLLDQATGD